MEIASRQHRQSSGAGLAGKAFPANSDWPVGAAWLEMPFQATVRGRSRSGERFCLDTVLDGLSPSFLALRLLWELELGQPLFVFIDLVLPPRHDIARSGVAVRGAVVGADERPGNVWRVTLEFTRQRFIYNRHS